MELKKLHSNVINRTRSSFLINNVCQCVVELVLNSLDANSTSIAIRINLITLRIQVVDNGEGISRENLEQVGLRYFTNKCKTLQELESCINYYGFRGEALANLVELSKSIHITSKHRNSSSTFSKVMVKNNCTVVKAAAKERPSVGTTVTVEGLFQNYPVRKNRIINELELDEIVKSIKGLVIMHHNINFSLRDDVSCELILSSSKTDNIVSAFKYIHPDIKEDGTLMKVSKGKITINSLLFKNFSQNKKIQYVFVNKRPVFSPKINKCVHKLFQQYCKQKRNEQSFPVYVLNIKCPYTEVDILLNATKAMVEFKHYEKLEYYIKKIINSFFGNSNHPPKPIQLHSVTDKGKSECGISQIQGVVRAFGYKRKHSESGDAEGSKRLQQNDMSHEEENDIIEATPFVAKNKNFNFKQPLPITIVPKEIIVKSNQNNINCYKSISKFTNDENKGKNLIMNMFLKSTQVYKSDEDIKDLSQDSQETVYEEESNFLMENNIETIQDGEKKAMSMSVNVKSTTKIRKSKKNIRTKSIQTSFDKNVTSKGLQTTFNEQPNIFSDGNKYNSGSADNYTLVFSKQETPFLKFFNKKPDPTNNFNFEFTETCKCNCHEKNMFNFNVIVDQNFDIPDLIRSKSKKNVHTPFWKIKKRPKINYKPKLFETSPYFRFNNQLQSNFCNPRYFFNKLGDEEIIKQPQLLLDDAQDTDELDKFCNTTIKSFRMFNPVYRSTQNDRYQRTQEKSNNYFTNLKPKFLKNELVEEQPSTFQRNSPPKIIKDTINNKCYENEVAAEENFNNSELVITLSEKGKLDLLEKELGAEKSMLMKEFLAWNSQFTQSESRTSENDGGDWIKQKCLGRKCFVNKKTGFVTYTTPKRNEKLYALSERNEFLPKGMSPIMKEIKPVDKSLSQNGKETLLEYIMEIYKNELLYVKWQHYLNDMDPNTFFEKMYKAKLELFENCIPNIVNTKKINENGINFTRNIFKDIEIIGQLDRKFIIVKDEKNSLITVFDQHAVHERIRLENLSKIYKNSKAICKEAVFLFLPQHDISLLKRCETYLNYVGISLEYLSNCIRITEVPFCIYVKFQQESFESLSNFIKIMINEVIELLKSTRAASLKILPRVVQNVVNLEACRGAIKFGDFLNKQQCTELLQKLSLTELPFQCAHGRPTVTPLVKIDLNQIKNKIKPLNFQRLKMSSINHNSDILKQI